MKYSQYPYKRIDIKSIEKEVKSMIEKFNTAISSDEQIIIIEKYQKIQKEYYTYSSIANLNFSRNTKSKKAINENNFYDQISPEISEIDNLFTKAIDASIFKKELEEKFGKHFFNLISMELKSFDPKLVPLMKKENELKNKYEVYLLQKLNIKAKY